MGGEALGRGGGGGGGGGGYGSCSSSNNPMTYLCGDGFTAADLTFAALASIVVLPPPGSKWPCASILSVEDLVDEKARAAILELRASRAGQHALRCYDIHR